MFPIRKNRTTAIIDVDLRYEYSPANEKWEASCAIYTREGKQETLHYSGKIEDIHYAMNRDLESYANRAQKEAESA